MELNDKPTRKYYSIVDIECPICGKNFVPAPMHIYNDSGYKGGKPVCSYTCHLEAFRRKEAEKKKKKHYRQLHIAPGRNDEIRRLAKEGVSYTEIAQKFGIGVPRVQQIICEKRNDE